MTLFDMFENLDPHKERTIMQRRIVMMAVGVLVLTAIGAGIASFPDKYGGPIM